MKDWVENNYSELEDFDIEYNLDAITKDRVINDVLAVYKRFCKPMISRGFRLSDANLNKLSAYIIEDLKERIKQDPIAISDHLIYEVSKSFKVIFYHRIANLIFNLDLEDELNVHKLCAFNISEYAAVRCGIEIHPQASIGRRFVIDHGINTLIGATSVIGDDCTILQNVVLGARKITFNNDHKRHPTIGNNVRVSGGVRILGPISIGDNVIIYPDCIVTNDIPKNTEVKLHKTVMTYRLRKESR